MGTAILQIKIMPEGVDTDLEAIKAEVVKKLEKENIKSTPRFEEQPIAFGLKALMVTTIWPEEKDTDLAADLMKTIPGVSQADITDYRRAIG